MKTVISGFILFAVLYSISFSQSPQYYNYNTSNAGSNTLPLGTSVGSLVQWLVRPGEICHPTIAKSGKITSVYFLLIARLGPYEYSRVSILLGQTTLTSLPNYVFFTDNMDTVYHRDSMTIYSEPVGVHFHKFTLDKPFIYDSTKSLVIQLEHYGHSPGTASYIHGHTFLTDKRRNYCTVPPFYIPNQDAYVVNFGIDVEPLTGVEPTITTKIPSEFNLYQNYPNPFNPETNISFDMPESGFISLKVFNSLGEEVATLVNEFKNKGSYNVSFDGANLSSGIYFYKLEYENFVSIKKMMLIK